MKSPEHGPEDIRPEYEFRGGERGKYADQMPKGSRLVTLEPALATVFTDSESVNRALRAFIASGGAASSDFLP
jgi:hypothetical protein